MTIEMDVRRERDFARFEFSMSFGGVSYITTASSQHNCGLAAILRSKLQTEIYLTSNGVYILIVPFLQNLRQGSLALIGGEHLSPGGPSPILLIATTRNSYSLSSMSSVTFKVFSATGSRLTRSQRVLPAWQRSTK